MPHTPGIVARTVLMVTLIMVPLRASLGAGYQLMFAVKHEHATARHDAGGGPHATLWKGAQEGPAQASHACCFQFTMAAVLHEIAQPPLLRPAQCGRDDPLLRTFIPDRPHKPPKVA